MTYEEALKISKIFNGTIVEAQELGEIVYHVKAGNLWYIRIV